MSQSDDNGGGISPWWMPGKYLVSFDLGVWGGFLCGALLLALLRLAKSPVCLCILCSYTFVFALSLSAAVAVESVHWLARWGQKILWVDFAAWCQASERVGDVTSSMSAAATEADSAGCSVSARAAHLRILMSRGRRDAKMQKPALRCLCTFVKTFIFPHAYIIQIFKNWCKSWLLNCYIKNIPSSPSTIFPWNGRGQFYLIF